MSAIVVGVDGSEGSIRALRFAFDEARIRDAEITAVSAWTLPVAAYEAGWLRAPVEFGEFSNSARATLDTSLESVGAATSGIKVTKVVSEGQPADVLCSEAKDAELLVVGSRGMGGFGSLVLGSVSQQCLHHTPCALVIVPS